MRIMSENDVTRCREVIAALKVSSAFQQCRLAVIRETLEIKVNLLAKTSRNINNSYNFQRETSIDHSLFVSPKRAICHLFSQSFLHFRVQ